MSITKGNRSKNITLCGSPIAKLSDEKIINSSSSSIGTYIRMLSNKSNDPDRDNTNTNQVGTHNKQLNHDSNNQLKNSMQSSVSRNKGHTPPEGNKCYKTTPELITNPYISKAILNKINEIILENSSEVTEFKRKFFFKTIMNLNEQCRVQSENKKNEIIKMLTKDLDRDRDQDRDRDKLQKRRSTFSVNKIVSVNQSSKNILKDRSPSVIKVTKAKQMLDNLFDECGNRNYNNNAPTIASIGKKITNKGSNKPHNNSNGIKSRLLSTYNSSKDVLKRKREEDENDVDQFKMQLNSRKFNRLINYSNFNHHMHYLKNIHREEYKI